jgi:hypothetical protein
MVQAMANALRTGGSGTWTCDGNTWDIGLCGTASYAIGANGADCSCLTPDWVARPCINNSNWGGVNTASCSSPSQTITVEFCPSSSCDTYSEAFVNGSTATAQCTTWNSWRAGLATSGYSTVTMSGTYDTTGITCSDPTTAQAIADAVRTATSGSWTCDGHTWYLCGTRYSGELWIDAPSLCSGSNCPNPGYLMRACISNANWGGVNTATCTSNPSQTMTLDFCGGGGSGGSLTGTARMTSGSWIPVRYEVCGAPGSCTANAAKAACTAVGEQVISHASNGTTEVYSLGATTSCNYSTSYFTISTAAPAGSCLVGISNLEWSSCCGTTRWHGNTLDFGSAGVIFGYVYSSNSGYVSTYPNIDGTHWACYDETVAASNRTGCTTQYVACTN